MKMTRSKVFGRSIALSSALVLLGVGLSGCGPIYDVEYDEVYSDVAPPAPNVEDPGQPPSSDHFWVNGYWHYTGARYVWIRGHWVVRPSVDTVWVPSGWVVVGSRYRYVPGRWAASRQLPRYQYVHPRPRYYRHYAPPQRRR